MTVTGIMGFVAVQRALGALAFMPMLEANTPQVSALGDPGKCLNGTYTSTTLKELYLREMRCAVPPPSVLLSAESILLMQIWERSCVASDRIQ